MRDQETLLYELDAKEQIRSGLLRFSRGLDARSPGLATSPFLAAAKDIHPPLGTWTAAEMKDRLALSFAEMFDQSQYFVGLPYIEVAGPTAKSETYVWAAKRTFDTDEHGYNYLRLSGMVYFDDWLRGEDGSWRIAERRFVPVWELFHSIGAEPENITRHYKPATRTGRETTEENLDYARVAKAFWGHDV